MSIDDRVSPPDEWTLARQHDRRLRPLEREKLAAIKRSWIYVGTYPTDPLTTPDSPPFQNGWSNAGGTDVPARYRLSPDDNLEIEGDFGGGVSGSVAWTVGAAWFPDYRKIHPVMDSTYNLLALDVDVDGTVTPVVAGVVGPPGPAGPAGPTGANGANGTNGTNGATWRDGTGAPSSGLGVNGDYYLDDATGNVYLKASGSYSIVANIKGATGATGATGPAGAGVSSYTAAPSSDLTANGITIDLTAGEALAFGDPVYVKSDGKVWKADADTAGSFPAIGLATGTYAANATATILISGIARNDAWAWTVGGLVYLSTSSALTQTQPSSTDNAIQAIGVATNAHRLYVKPELTYLTHT